MNAAVVRPGHGAQLSAAVFRLEGLDLLGAVIGQAVLQVDPGQRRRQLPQVGGRRADDAGELAESPVRGCHGFMCFRQHKVQPLGVIARGLNPDIRRLHHPAAAALGPALHIGPEIIERQIPLIIGPVEPFGRHPPVQLTPAHIHVPATRPRRCDRIHNFHNAHRLSPATGAGSHSPNPQPVTGKPAKLGLSQGKRAEWEAFLARNASVLTCTQKWQRLREAFLAGRCARHAKLCSEFDLKNRPHAIGRSD